MSFLFWGYLLILLRQEVGVGAVDFRLAPAFCGGILLSVGFAKLRGGLPGARAGMACSVLLAIWLAGVFAAEAFAPVFAAGLWGTGLKAVAEVLTVLPAGLLLGGLSRLQLAEGVSYLSGALKNGWTGLIVGRAANLLLPHWDKGWQWCLLASVLTAAGFLICLRRSAGRYAEARRPGGPCFSADPLPENRPALPPPSAEIGIMPLFRPAAEPNQDKQETEKPEQKANEQGTKQAGELLNSPGAAGADFSPDNLPAGIRPFWEED